MDKLAQRRGKIDKFKEDWTPGALGGRALEEKFSPEFQELMEVLREVDDKVREIAVGEDEGESLKDLLKVAKTNFNRREYMTAIAFLGRFHDRLETISLALNKLNTSVDMKHYEFLFGDVEKEHLDYLTQKMGPKFEKPVPTKTSELSHASLEKEAGMADWWHNITSDRGKALSAWEKRFPKYARELKSQTNLMISKSESLLSLVLQSLKTMSGLRNSRKLEEYIKVAQKFQDKFKTYNTGFLTFYNTQVKRFLDYKTNAELLNNPPEDQNAIPTVKTDEADTNKVPGRPTKQQMNEVRKTLQEAKKKGPQAILDAIEKLRKQPGMSALLPRPQEPPPIPSQSVQSVELESLPTSKHPVKPIGSSLEYDPWSDVLPSSQFPDQPKLDLRHPVIPPPPRVPTELGDTMLSPGMKRPSSVGNMLPSAPIPLSSKDIITNPKPSSLGDQLPDTKPDPDTLKGLGKGPKKADHTPFLTALAALENEHPLLIAKEIITYANSIEATDVETSQRLLKIANNILKG